MGFLLGVIRHRHKHMPTQNQSEKEHSDTSKCRLCKIFNAFIENRFGALQSTNLQRLKSELDVSLQVRLLCIHS